MNRDFTYTKYEQLLTAILDAGYACIPTNRFFDTAKPLPEKLFILRHDVDRLPFNAVKLAQIQRKHEVTGTYYWRIHRESYNETAIRQVVDLGHELGYHYEDLTICKGNIQAAIRHFEEKLDHFRKFYPVVSICMHGSPMTKWDNRDIWNHANYRDYKVVSEPYYDFDFKTMFYLTDTGRHWNNKEISVRDKVDSGYDIPINGTDDIIQKLRSGQLPNHLMYNIHPQRWNNGLFLWSKELIGQNVKNVIKRKLVKP